MGEFGIVDKIGIAIALTCFILLIIYIFVRVIYDFCKEGGISFYANERLFDEKYLEIRKKHLDDPIGSYYAPLRLLFDIKLKNFKALQYYRKIKCEEDISEYMLYKIPLLDPDHLSIIIYELFDDIKDFNSPISNQFFEPMPARIDYWKVEKGYDIRTIVKNILSVVPTRELLSSNELLQFKYLLNEIAINGIIKNPTKYQEFVNLTKNMKFLEKSVDLSGSIFTHLIYPSDKKHINLLLEGISEQLQLKIKVYDLIYKAMQIEIPITTYSPENPLKELRFLNLGSYICYLEPPK